MASLLQKLLKVPRAPPPLQLRILPRLGIPCATDDAAAATPSRHHQTSPFLFPVNPDAGPEAVWRPPFFLSPNRVYPPFPQCFIAVDPIGGSGAEELIYDDGRETMTVWADSVKKKRKRKMNKHKLRKLRRRLRRQT